MKKIIVFLALACPLISLFASSNPVEPDQQSLKEFFAFPASIAIDTYRSFASRAIRSICPMTPSCSTYGRDALHRDGLLIGSLKIIDRLNRCGHDVYLYPVVQTEHGLRFADSIGDN